MRTISTLIVFLVVIVFFTEARTIKVPQDFLKIQLAINAAIDGDTVLVAEGTYTENILISKKIVVGSLYIKDEDTSHISKTILDGSTPTHPDSASVIRISTGTDSTTVISGFTIKNGLGTKLDLPGTYDWLSGGGIRIFAGSAKITHNIITSNTLNSSLGVYGGGISIDPVLGPIGYWVIEHNRIFSNSISSTSNPAEGAGVWMTDDGRFANNEVSSNIASSSTTYSAGGGIFLLPMPGHGTSTILIAGNIFQGNQASVGGGFWMGAHSTLTPRPIVTLMNNLIIGNTGASGSVMTVNSGDFILMNNTIVHNTGSEAIKLFDQRGTLTFKLLNNILWNPGINNEFNSIVKAEGQYNNVRGGMSGTGNINTDPLFVANDLLFHLSNSSPCIGTGIASASVGGVTLNVPLSDYFNTPRPRAVGTPPDMGAVENDLPMDEKAGLAVFGLGLGRSISFREITLSAAGTQVRARQYGPYVITKDSIVGNQHWYFEPGFNAWLWYDSGGLWLKFPPLTPTFDSSRNLFLKWPCQKGDTYNTKFLGLDVVATIDAIDSIVTVPAFTDTCVVITFRNSGQIMTKMFFAPGIGWIKEDDYYTYSTMDVINFLPLVTYPHFRYEVTAFSPTGVKELDSETPLNWKLMQNYPNPFNPSTTIRYALSSTAYVKLTIYDLLGREIATLVNEEQTAGWKEVKWNGSGYASGMYLVKMLVGNFSETKKIVLMK